MSNGNEQQEMWEATAAQITQMHKMLKVMNLKQFIEFSELHISGIENRKDIDIQAIIKQKAAVEAFRDKARHLRTALINMEQVAKKFQAKHGKKDKKEPKPLRKIIT